MGQIGLIKNLYKIFIFTTVIFFGSFFVLNNVLAQNAGDIAKDTLDNSFIEGTGVSQINISTAVSSSITIVLSLVGMIFLILAFYAGYIWTTSQGDSTRIENAKQTILRASIGFVVVVASYAITLFVTTFFTDNAVAPTDVNEIETVVPGPIGCCLDRVSGTGQPGSTGLGIWTDRMATHDECARAGNDPNDPSDVRYGSGTWEWLGAIDNPAECEIERRQRRNNND